NTATVGMNLPLLHIGWRFMPRGRAVTAPTRRGPRDRRAWGKARRDAGAGDDRHGGVQSNANESWLDSARANGGLGAGACDGAGPRWARHSRPRGRAGRSLADLQLKARGRRVLHRPGIHDVPADARSEV